MKIENIKQQLEIIPAPVLARIFNVSHNMARKYKKYPHLHTPSAIQAVDLFNAYSIPVVFWKEIRRVS